MNRSKKFHIKNFLLLAATIATIAEFFLPTANSAQPAPPVDAVEVTGTIRTIAGRSFVEVLNGPQKGDYLISANDHPTIRNMAGISVGMDTLHQGDIVKFMSNQILRGDSPVPRVRGEITLTNK